MARPRKLPTKLVRLNVDLEKTMRKNAKRKGMSLPDYLNWRLTR